MDVLYSVLLLVQLYARSINNARNEKAQISTIFKQISLLSAFREPGSFSMVGNFVYDDSVGQLKLNLTIMSIEIRRQNWERLAFSQSSVIIIRGKLSTKPV